MTRFYYFGALLAMATLMVALSSVPILALDSSGSPRVEHVAVQGSGDAAEVEIQTSGAKIAPNTEIVTGPDRIIVDFPGALPAAELHAFVLKVNSGALRDVRAGLFFNDPPITRIVIDLAEPRSYQISTTRDGIAVKLGPATPTVAKLDSPKPALAKVSLSKIDRVMTVDAPTAECAARDRHKSCADASLESGCDGANFVFKCAFGGRPVASRCFASRCCWRCTCAGCSSSAAAAGYGYIHQWNAYDSLRQSYAGPGAVPGTAADAGRDCHSCRG